MDNKVYINPWLQKMYELLYKKFYEVKAKDERPDRDEESDYHVTIHWDDNTLYMERYIPPIRIDIWTNGKPRHAWLGDRSLRESTLTRDIKLAIGLSDADTCKTILESIKY